MASGDQDYGCSQLEGIQHELLIHPAGAHGSDDSLIGRILKTGHAGKVRAPIRAPVAGKHYCFLHVVLVKDGLYLGCDLIVGKVPHGDRAKGTFGPAGTATGAGSVDDLGRGFALPIHLDALIGTGPVADLAGGTQVFVYDGGYRLHLDSICV